MRVGKNSFHDVVIASFPRSSSHFSTEKKKEETERESKRRRERKNEGRLLNVIKCNATRRVSLLGTLSIT